MAGFCCVVTKFRSSLITHTPADNDYEWGGTVIPTYHSYQRTGFQQLYRSEVIEIFDIDLRYVDRLGCMQTIVWGFREPFGPWSTFTDR